MPRTGTALARSHWMSEDEVILHGNEVFEIEVRGFDHIPETERPAPLCEGPIAAALGGADLSGLVGFPVSMFSYAWLTRVVGRRAQQAQSVR